MEEEKYFEKSVPLYPFNGRSSNLIDKFYIFGYNYLTLKKHLIDEEPKISEIKVNSHNIGAFKLNEEPSILFEVTNNFNKEIIGPDEIKQFIFPNGLFICFRRCYPEDNNLLKKPSQKVNYSELEKNVFSKIDLSDDKSGCPRGVRSVFTCCPIEGLNKKKSQNGFGYIFYRKFWRKKEIENIEYIFYIPYTFCIMSEFPFYQNYETLFRCIRKMFSQENIYIPIEILLYKIVSLTPSPINTDVFLDLNLMCNQNKIFSKNTNEESKPKPDNKIPNLIKDNKEKESHDKEKEVDDFILVTKKDIVINDIINTRIKFKYLSGYPLIQYNLAKVLFHKLSIDDIIIIFFFSFIETNIIFFSEDIEYLTLIINAIYNLNYPFNDTLYFYNIVAISLEDFQKGDIFGIKASSSIIAINNRYLENYLSNINKIDEHLVVDLDNNNIFIKCIEKDHPYFKLIEMIKNLCIKNIDYEYLKETKLYQAINNLYYKLSEIEKQKKYFLSYQFVDFKDEPYIEELNKYIQESFYECVIVLSLYLYENITIIKEDDKEKPRKENNNLMKLDFDKNYVNKKNYKKEELLILDELVISMKFSSSFSQFIFENNPIDLYKIPLNFTEEFLSIFSKIKLYQKNTNIKYFHIIDKLYLSKKLPEAINIDFYSDIIQYIDNYKNIFDREIIDNQRAKYINDYSKLTKIINYQKKYILKYQTYELNDIILIKYIHKIGNLSYNLRPNNSLEENNKLQNIIISEIEKTVEKYFMDNKFISNDELCFENIIIIFCLSLNNFTQILEGNDYLKCLLENINPFRKHIVLLLQIIYKLYKLSIEKKNHNISQKMKLYYVSCINYIKEQNIIPNKILMGLINENIYLENEEKRDNNKTNEEIKFNIINKNIYIHHNFSFSQFYKENYIVEIVNSIYKEYADKYNEDKIDIDKIRIRYVKNKNEIIESYFMSQKSLNEKLTEEFNKCHDNLLLSKLNNKLILDSCLNIIIFIRNNKSIQKLNDMIKIMSIIFYIFLNNK